ncbi:hypothetical protein IMZ48_49950 [Candidatus Bathyarchaeota archaeon]|nr:hypothetical protein [Candidatus Bathyarchaeota archaeon]
MLAGRDDYSVEAVVEIRSCTRDGRQTGGCDKLSMGLATRKSTGKAGVWLTYLGQAGISQKMDIWMAWGDDDTRRVGL